MSLHMLIIVRLLFPATARPCRGIFNRVFSRIRAVTATAIIAAVGVLHAGLAVAESMPGRDQSFLRSAVETSHAGIQASRLALMRSDDPDVKLFATLMLDEYTRMGAQLQQLLMAKDLQPPAQAGIMQRAKLSLLAKLHGKLFDHQYIRMIGVAAHQDALALFSKAVVGASDHDVRLFASRTLPNLQHHLNLATVLKAKLDARN